RLVALLCRNRACRGWTGADRADRHRRYSGEQGRQPATPSARRPRIGLVLERGNRHDRKCGRSDGCARPSRHYTARGGRTATCCPTSRFFRWTRLGALEAGLRPSATPASPAEPQQPAPNHLRSDFRQLRQPISRFAASFACREEAIVCSASIGAYVAWLLKFTNKKLRGEAHT